ncbi:FTR1 family iron permease [Streptococcus oricebi]|uniref:FTR1 family iron permease n=1 Tax=Streptococcus oricebi TaxID=1547447 RepID=A0ABS5B0J8_9STRE|nr:FTR1 family protein [Streptococcus oricebi]MBP2622351.1 FTR1 family iron permease [Streptococcus oricebi]
MVKNYLSKILWVLGLLLTLGFTPVLAEESYSNLFIKITDATEAVKAQNQDEAKRLLTELQTEFANKENHDSAAGKKVTQALNIEGAITEEKLTEISAALIAFDQEQHPVDLKAEKEKLVNRMTPAFDKLEAAIKSKDLEASKTAYKEMNRTWTSNESIVRSSSTAHYGKIETALSLLRSSMETEPTDFTTIEASFADLKTALDQFVTGEKVAAVSENLTLNDGIKMLEEALSLFQKGEKEKASTLMKKFITIWPTIEGDVSTRDSSLYTRVESQTPVIMVKGNEKKYQEELAQLITDLSKIDTSASYNFFDAMLILLREGVESLLIIMALVATLKASKMTKGLVWVYSGAALGVLASVLIAILLQVLFPALASGANREIIEGAVGIFAVVMMILIGIWLHSKSSIEKWNDFMDRQMKTVTTSGSFISMFALSFLAVFREGAETILFYVGIVPRITMFHFLLGIALAILVLVIIALVMTKATSYFKPHRIFFWLTWLIYALAFKMLGVSIHALQLTNIAPNHLLNSWPTIDLIGFYPSPEGVLAQLVLLVIIAWFVYKNRRTKHD